MDLVVSDLDVVVESVAQCQLFVDLNNERVRKKMRAFTYLCEDGVGEYHFLVDLEHLGLSSLLLREEESVLVIAD